MTIEEDGGVLRQDRYPLRTSPQFIGPQIEDLLVSLKTITIECNSSTSKIVIGTVYDFMKYFHSNGQSSY